ncbi:MULTISPECIES: class I SAM-dependent methyltransferase [unclassified Paenibacillus]|uniref:class I SAM-dependent methyltransferase n=1 Tax=unclassified Paenibacillus TaxID=185978 RepID=UPI001C120165|nr:MULTISPECIES: class I SAM-dependent methyltransferase [unclassified Paenibacillus]MBU5445493.1 class I SAM-dependent methyltransferase [Paenibacillus sp. MSJ-34]CAH0122024.1 hypothetical protein PAE9249_04561 [Paenibacillus sp. CECT 9249]
MGFLSVLSFAHKLVKERVRSGDAVVDATVGTGVDTLFLAQAAGETGTVYGFDIQPQALALAEERLRKALGERCRIADGSGPEGGRANVRLLLRSHAELAAALPAPLHGRIAAVMFNLGYLPAAFADTGVITLAETTLPALEGALAVLKPGGIATIVLYPGHEGGGAEADAVERWCAALPGTTAQAVIYRMLQKSDAPYMIALEKK